MQNSDLLITALIIGFGINFWWRRPDTDDLTEAVNELRDAIVEHTEMVRPVEPIEDMRNEYDENEFVMPIHDPITEIMAERQRQITEEGHTPEMDDRYEGSQLARAAGCYALSGTRQATAVWPWSIRFWKPTTPRRDLIKAGALIVAEIERLDRMEAKNV